VSSRVVSVSLSPQHTFSKENVASITLVAGLGVAGDAHSGVTVKHRSRVARNPDEPNLRQVHLLHRELFAELGAKGYAMEPGQLGENILTEGVDLLALPVDTELRIGAEAIVRLTGLRNPCRQLDRFRPGLMAAVLDRTPDGQIVRKAGVMSVVVTGGVVRAGDAVSVRLPSTAHRALPAV
jgi:MOSC domain-containing protein YiiM